MLTLTIEAGAAPGGEQARTVYRTGATIGRGEVNDWVLPDPNRHLSKRHCVIAWRDGAYTLTDTSTNGVFVNSAAQAVGRGNSVPLRDGDRIRIGEYVIRVSLAPDTEPAAPPAAARTPAPTDTFTAKLTDALGLPAENKDPFGLHAAGAPVEMPAPPAPPPPQEVPDAIDEALGFLPPERTLAGAPPRPPLPEITPLGNLDDDPIFGPPRRAAEAPQRGAEPDHLPTPQQHFRPPRVVEPAPAAASVIPEDWDPLGPEEPAPEPAPEPAQEGAPEPAPAAPALADLEIEPAAVPPPPEPEPLATATVMRRPAAAAEPAPATPLPQAAARPPSDADRGALAAFLAGAGVDLAGLSDAEAAAMMRTAGECFRAMVAGMREILMARASLKNEFRVERTMIRAADNNPLKFSPSPEDSLLALLKPPARGYMPGPAAVAEGFRDMEAHQLATLAGMQVALGALLAQFDPKNLKQRLEQHSLLASLLPAMRKAKYWEIYEALFDKVAQEAQDSFHGVYGRAFAKAYEEQVQQVKKA